MKPLKAVPHFYKFISRSLEFQLELCETQETYKRAYTLKHHIDCEPRYFTDLKHVYIFNSSSFLYYLAFHYIRHITAPDYLVQREQQILLACRSLLDGSVILNHG